MFPTIHSSVFGEQNLNARDRTSRVVGLIGAFLGFLVISLHSLSTFLAECQTQGAVLTSAFPTRFWDKAGVPLISTSLGMSNEGETTGLYSASDPRVESPCYERPFLNNNNDKK